MIRWASALPQRASASVSLKRRKSSGMFDSRTTAH
jgi:hypothetical protein